MIAPVRRRAAHLRTLGRERGAGGDSLVLVIISVALLVLMSFGIAAMRFTEGSSRVEQAAVVAARAASLKRDEDSARSAAQDTARMTLADAGTRCTDLNIGIDVSAFRAPAYTPGTITVTVTCTVDWSDLVVPGLPGSKTLTATATSPLDVTRERG